MVKTVLFILPSEQYFKCVLSILKKEVKKEKVIYVTTNKPCNHLMNLFKEEGINARNIFFIDCISKQVKAKEKEKEPENCLFLESPQQITGLSLAINQAIKLMPSEKMVFFDSLSALLIYNNESVIGKFSNFIINRMRSENISTVMIVLESDMDKKIIKTIESFVDEVKKWCSK